jgi:nicotinate phosphoribosyltransferase
MAPEAGVLAARAAYIGGCVGTSNVEADYRFGVPCLGTVGHSFVMAHSDEQQSFRDVSRIFPGDAVLLLDTYDTLAALEKLIGTGLRPSGVRLDSGDRLALSKEVRRRLDSAGLSDTKIFVSGDLDEEAIGKLLVAGAPIDAFGVGTALATSVDFPALSSVYKLVEYAGQPRLKLSEAKPSYPGKKQVFRSQENGHHTMDVIACAEETMPGQPLLECFMKTGKRIFPALRLEEIRKHARRSILNLHQKYGT